MEITLPLSEALRQQVMEAFDNISNLPFPIYASDVEGQFLCANEQARTFFELDPAKNLSDHNIAPYYEEEQARLEVLRQLQKVMPGEWHRDLPVRLRIQNESKKIRFVSRPFFEQGKMCAMLCMIIRMSDAEWFAEFEDSLQDGFFELGRGGAITDCNLKFAKNLAYSTSAELKGKLISELFWDKEEAEKFFHDLRATQRIEDQQFKMRRADDAMVIVKMNCLGDPDQTERTGRIKGVLRDSTFEAINEALPVGLFLINTTAKGEEIFSSANPRFAEIHGFQTLEEIIGKPINFLYKNPAAMTEYRSALDKEDRKGKPLLDHYMNILDVQGKTHNVVVNVGYVPGENHRIRVGAVYDVTDHVRGQMYSLETDFSAVLHTYIATVNGLRDTMRNVIDAHSQDLKKDARLLDHDKIASEMVGHKKRIEDLLQDLSKAAVERDIEEIPLAEVQKSWKKLDSGRMSAEGAKGNASQTRASLIQVRKRLDALMPLQFAKETIKSLKLEIDEMLRLTSITSLSIAVDEINERIHDFEFFRDYLLSAAEPVELKFESRNLLGILEDTTKHLSEFASLQKVDIERQYRWRDNIPVLCQEMLLKRAFHNVVHNAIKYSWSKGADRQAWIVIKVERKQEEVEILIENWGVPIRQEELKENRILGFGRRGKEADDRGRAGTGIGLYDTYNIINLHKGSLKVTSEPVGYNLPTIYSNPFITRVRITLPIAK